MSIRIVARFTCLAATAVILSGCLGFGGGDSAINPAAKQLPAETQVQLAKLGMTQESPIFVRIFKEESQLEIWKEKPDGRYYYFKTYPICSWSGELGPKVKAGDKQAPEGFYTVAPGQMNPNSQFHLAFNIGFPNAYDKMNGHTGDALMVHGDCRSAGCYAMTDALIEEIYALAREAFRGGQTKFNVNVFPFRMTDQNMKRHRDSKWYGFWKTLKIGYDDFELSHKPPKVAVCSRQYLVNADFPGHEGVPDGADSCPTYRHMPIDPFNPLDRGPIMAKAPATTGTANSHVAAYSTPAGEKPILAAATRADAHIPVAPAAKPEPSPKTATLSSQPTRTARAIAPKAEEPAPVSLAAGVATTPIQTRPPVNDKVQPVSATLSEAPVIAEPEPENAANQPPVTRGLHNVVESGKGDMLSPSEPAQ